jgi:hypothetical protein
MQPELTWMVGKVDKSNSNQLPFKVWCTSKRSINRAGALCVTSTNLRNHAKILSICSGACSWGPSWGLKGSFRMAYGAANIMQPDYTFALEYNAASMAARALQVNRRLQPGMSNIPSTAAAGDWRPECLAYTPKTPLRLVKLAADLSVVAATALAPAMRLRKADIIADLVTSNLGYLPNLSTAKTGPFRLCGRTAQMLSGVLLSARPSPSPVPLPSPSPGPAKSPAPVVPSPSPTPPPGKSDTSARLHAAPV